MTDPIIIPITHPGAITGIEITPDLARQIVQMGVQVLHASNPLAECYCPVCRPMPVAKNPAPVAADKPAVTIPSDSMGEFMSQMYADQPAGDDAAVEAHCPTCRRTADMDHRDCRNPWHSDANRETVADLRAKLAEYETDKHHEIVKEQRDRLAARVAELEREAEQRVQGNAEARRTLIEAGRATEIERDKALAELAAARANHEAMSQDYLRITKELAKALLDLAAMTERAERLENDYARSLTQVRELTERAEKAEALLAGAIFSGRLDDLKAGDLQAFASNARAEADAAKAALATANEECFETLQERDALKARKVKLPAKEQGASIGTYAYNEAIDACSSAIRAAGVEVS